MTIQGPAYVHIYAPCPTGWRMRPELAIESARLAVQTRVFPLYEVIDGQYVLSRKVDKPKPLKDYFKPQGRFKHLDEATLAYIEARVNQEYERIVRLAEITAPPAVEKPAGE